MFVTILLCNTPLRAISVNLHLRNYQLGSEDCCGFVNDLSMEMIGLVQVMFTKSNHENEMKMKLELMTMNGLAPRTSVAS